MNSPETRTNISPAEMHRNIEMQYGALPPKASFAKAIGITAAVIAGFFYIFLPTTHELGDLGEIINIFGFLVATSYVFVTLGNYFTARNNRQQEMDRRQKVKDEYARMSNWYANEEHVHRNSTKGETGRSTYPIDWADRKRYVKSRDGACFLCKGSRDNDRYYFYWPRDGRHLNKSGKDFALYDQVHHIVPISRGGTHEVSNLVYLCNLCHEDQHPHLLRRRLTTLERKSKQARNPALKSFWGMRLGDVRKRLSSLEQHMESPDCLKLHRFLEMT